MIQKCPKCGLETDVSTRIAGDIIWCSQCGCYWTVTFTPIIEEENDDDIDDIE